jgi:hypothetical protein
MWILLCLPFADSFAQSLSARISNPRIDGGTFKWDIEINRTDDWGSGGGNDILGNCDFYFNVNKHAFTAAIPTLSNIHSAISGNTNYTFATGRAQGNNQAYVALTYDPFGFGSNWYPPLNSWELLFTAGLVITDPNQNSGLAWIESSTGFSKGNREPLTKTLSGNGDISLPVELTSFAATVGDNKVILKWVTQSEVNNLGFEVYRSAAENGEYALIATYENDESLQGAGNSNAAREYTYEDNLTFNGETYWYQIADVDYGGIRTFHGPVSVESPDMIPEDYKLHPNYPNPFNPETNIRFEIPASPANSKVKLIVYNNLGMEVRTLINGIAVPGIHTVTWDGRNNYGGQMASGVYFLRLQAGTFHQAQKMLLVR